jgi:hypothetical protein
MRNCAAIIGLLTLSAGTAFGHTPIYVPDVELAAKPIIVIARWKNSNPDTHASRGKPSDQVAMQSWLIVDRVVAGDIKPGKYRFSRAADSFWNAMGKPTFGETEWYTPLEVEDVTVPNLWFVSRYPNPNPNDKTECLSSATGRAVQPISLEKFYVILRGPDRNVRISEALLATDPLTLLRAMRFVNGDRVPWPYDFSIDSRMDDYRQKPQKPLIEHAAEVGRLINSNHVKVRRLAAATFAALAGRTSVSAIRRLLGDPDAETRLIAVGALAQSRDIVSRDRFAAAVREFKDSNLGCALIDRLISWGDTSVVPPLITFLESDSSSGTYGDYYYIPAIQARAVLRKITGFVFPLDIKSCEAAWRQAMIISDSNRRRAKLIAILGDHADPLAARIYNRKGPPRVIVSNRSPRDITIARMPPDITMSYNRDGGQSVGGYFGNGPERSASDFVVLHPGEKLTVPLRLDKETWRDYQYGPVSAHTLAFTYTSMGRKFGKKAWIGSVPVRFEAGWTRPPDLLVNIREKWPNGHVKVTGQKLNGQEIGLWRYYNEAGKLVRAEDHLKNGSTAGLNLDYLAKHPR